MLWCLVFEWLPALGEDIDWFKFGVPFDSRGRKIGMLSVMAPFGPRFSILENALAEPVGQSSGAL